MLKQQIGDLIEDCGIVGTAIITNYAFHFDSTVAVSNHPFFQPLRAGLKCCVFMATTNERKNVNSSRRTFWTLLA